MASFAGLFILLGTIFALATGGVRATGIVIHASNIVQSHGNTHLIDVYSRHTPITIHTNPANQTSDPVRIDVYQGIAMVSITRSVRTGETAFLTLLDNPATGVPFFHGVHDPDDRIIIHVTAGGLLAILHIRIQLSMHMVEFDTVLQQHVAGIWLTPQNQRLSLHTYQINPASYRIKSTFRIFGVELFNTETNFNMFRAIDMEAYGMGTGIELFRPHPIVGPHIYIPRELLTTQGGHPFALEVDFAGRTFNRFFNIYMVA